MTHTITLQDLNAAIVAAIRERGEEYVYPQVNGVCFYRNIVKRDAWGDILGTEGKAGCIVGCAFDTLGILPEKLPYSESGKVSYEGVTARQLARSLGVTVTYEGEDVTEAALDALTILQSHQDAGNPWGADYDNGWLHELSLGLPGVAAEFRKAWVTR